MPSDRSGVLGRLALRSTLRPDDEAWVRRVLDATGFFRPEEVAIGVELVAEARARGAETSGYHFLFAEDPAAGGATIGYSCFGPIPLTVGSWDLYWIAVEPGCQGGGVGRALLDATERKVRQLGGARLFVDTSGRASYAPTRAFYRRCGYRQAAELEDFYAPGDAKVVFQRRLDGAQS